jgi:hypothetical protein
MRIRPWGGPGAHWAALRQLACQRAAGRPGGDPQRRLAWCSSPRRLVPGGGRRRRRRCLPASRRDQPRPALLNGPVRPAPCHGPSPATGPLMASPRQGWQRTWSPTGNSAASGHWHWHSQAPPRHWHATRTRTVTVAAALRLATLLPWSSRRPRTSLIRGSDSESPWTKPRHPNGEGDSESE